MLEDHKVCECPFVENMLDRRNGSLLHQGKDVDCPFGTSVSTRAGRNVEENMEVR